MRATTRIVAAVVALAMAVGAALIAIEIVLGYYFDRAPWVLPWRTWYRSARTTAWSDRAVVFTFGLIALAGLLLLLLALARRRPRDLELAAVGPATTTDVNRRSVERSLARAATDVEGIAAAHATLRRATVRVRAETNRRSMEGLRDDVRAAVTSKLEELRLVSPPSVAVAVESRRAAHET